MLRLALLLVLAAAPALSGCTLTFGVGSAARGETVRRIRSRDVAPESLRLGETVRIDRSGELPLVGLWNGAEVRRPTVASPTDTATFRIVVQGQEARIPASKAVRIRRWPTRPSILGWLVGGMAIDALLFGSVAYSISQSMFGG